MPVKLLEPLDSPLFYGTHLDLIRGRSLGEVVVYWSEWWLRKMCAWLKTKVWPTSKWSILGCVCFGWKSLLKMLFWKWGCLVGPENK